MGVGQVPQRRRKAGRRSQEGPQKRGMARGSESEEMGQRKGQRKRRRATGKARGRDPRKGHKKRATGRQSEEMGERKGCRSTATAKLSEDLGQRGIRAVELGVDRHEPGRAWDFERPDTRLVRVGRKAPFLLHLNPKPESSPTHFLSHLPKTPLLACCTALCSLLQPSTPLSLVTCYCSRITGLIQASSSQPLITLQCHPRSKSRTNQDGKKELGEECRGVGEREGSLTKGKGRGAGGKRQKPGSDVSEG